MFNALFVLIVFLMQLSKEKIHINWPFGVHTNITYNEETGEVGYSNHIYFIAMFWFSPPYNPYMDVCPVCFHVSNPMFRHISHSTSPFYLFKSIGFLSNNLLSQIKCDSYFLHVYFTYSVPIDTLYSLYNGARFLFVQMISKCFFKRWFLCLNYFVLHCTLLAIQLNLSLLSIYSKSRNKYMFKTARHPKAKQSSNGKTRRTGLLNNMWSDFRNCTTKKKNVQNK